MLTTWKNVPSAICMQICAAITEKYIFSYSSVNITDNDTITVSTSMSDFTCLKKNSMHISAAITEKCIFSYRSVNITDNGAIRLSTPMF